MSILIKRIDSSSGGGSKGYPIGNVTNVTIKGGYKKVTIKWTDPDDIVVGDKTLSTWQSTTLVRKKGSIPNSIKDGDIILETTEKDKYKDTEYIDSDLEIDTYYYRFFVCNTDKIYNNDSSMIYSTTVVEFDPVLKNNTWDQIAAASEAGIASSLWNIGDEIDITLSGTYNETVTLQIWDFNHFDKSDGSGKAGICFGMKNLMKDCNRLVPYSDTDFSYWNGTTMKKTTLKNILANMTSELQNVIKEVNTYASTGGGESNPNTGKVCKDKIFIPGFTEVDNDYSYQNITESNQKTFPIFTNDNSRIKKLSNGTGAACDWWTRSCYWGAVGGKTFCHIFSNGGGGSYESAHYSKGTCFCFNV